MNRLHQPQTLHGSTMDTAPHPTTAPAAQPLHYTVGIPHVLLAQRDIFQQIMHFAFDTLGVQQPELDIRDGE